MGSVAAPERRLISRWSFGCCQLLFTGDCFSLTATTLDPFGAGVDTVATVDGAAGAASSSSLGSSGCWISRSLADGSGADTGAGLAAFGESSFGVRGFDSPALEGAVVRLAGAGSDLGGGAVSDRVGVEVDAGAGAGVGVEADLVGAAGMGADEDEMDLVSRSIIFGRAFLPPSHSDAVRAGSLDGAGGKMLRVSLHQSSRSQGSSLGLEALGFTGHDEAERLDGPAGELESSGDFVLADIQRSARGKGETSFCRELGSFAGVKSSRGSDDLYSFR